MQDIDPKLLKVVALAKDGVGGEKETAIRIVKRLCAELGLDYDDVMNAQATQEYTFYYERNNERSIVSQILYKFATVPEHPGIRINKYYKKFFVRTTAAKYIEASQAIAVYIAAYRKERRRIITDLPDAFIYKHNIFGGFDEQDDKPPKEFTEAQLERERRAAALGSTMDDVTLTKAIEAGKENGQ